MKHRILSAIALTVIPLMAACTTTPTSEVTRFHLGDTSMLGRGPISIEAGQGLDPTSIEFRTWSAAVAQQLTAAGYTVGAPGTSGGQVAQIGLARQTYQAMRDNNPVSVGVGGATGSYGGGVGVGIGFDLSGTPANQISTELRVNIRDTASGKTVWEGRANNMVSAKSSLASPQASAQKLATALFQGFPGNSGETITVK